jgi:AcrR family transcriptional regulator
MGELRHTRERLLEAALDLFTQHGYDATSMQLLADRLGVTKAALYYYFPAKRDILRALIEPMTTDLETRLDRAEAFGTHYAEAGVADYVDFLISQRPVLAFMHQDTSWLGEMTELAARHRVTRARIEALLFGKNLDLDGRVRFTVAMAGVQAAVALHPDADPAELRQALIGSINSVIEPVRQRA